MVVVLMSSVHVVWFFHSHAVIMYSDLSEFIMGAHSHLFVLCNYFMRICYVVCMLWPECVAGGV